jgi:hypothetical protein
MEVKGIFNITQRKKGGGGGGGCFIFLQNKFLPDLHTAVLWGCDEHIWSPTDTKFAPYPSPAAHMELKRPCQKKGGVPGGQATAAAQQLCWMDGDKEHGFGRTPSPLPPPNPNPARTIARINTENEVIS